MGQELWSAIAACDDDDSVRAIIVTGAGRCFCAGAELDAGGKTFVRGDTTWEEAAQAEERARAWNLKKPVIAAINGAAIGVGAALTLPMDIRIASDKAKIGFVFTRRGIMPEQNATWYLPRLVGMAKAMELMLTGRTLDAHGALAYGLVSRVVPHDVLLPEATEIARDIARFTAPVSVAITKQLMWRQLMDSDPRSGRKSEDEYFRWLGSQPDAVEGVNAFMQKRDPEWSMRASMDMPPRLSKLDE
jgi:enoyl-CoA hydratase/carnithine racemase